MIKLPMKTEEQLEVLDCESTHNLYYMKEYSIYGLER